MSRIPLTWVLSPLILEFYSTDFSFIGQELPGQAGMPFFFMHLLCYIFLYVHFFVGIPCRDSKDALSISSLEG